MATHPLLVSLRPVADALGAELVPVRLLEEGDVPLHWEGELVGGFRLPSLHDALGRLLARTEAELGQPLVELSREEKQAVVARLDDAGAFLLRRSVDEVADVLGVSRFTIYNYLNARD